MLRTMLYMCTTPAASWNAHKPRDSVVSSILSDSRHLAPCMLGSSADYSTATCPRSSMAVRALTAIPLRASRRASALLPSPIVHPRCSPPSP